MRIVLALAASFSGCCLSTQTPTPQYIYLKEQPPSVWPPRVAQDLDPIAGADRWMPECGARLADASAIGEARIEAFRAKDIIKLLCVDDKAAQADAHLAVLQRRLAGARAATDEAEVRRELRAVLILCDRIALLTAEAASCAGEDGAMVQAWTAPKPSARTPGTASIRDRTSPRW